MQAILHKKIKRFNVLVCHRRFGKTIFCLNHLLAKALSNTKRNPQYAYIAPTYKQAKRIAWDPLKEYARKLPGYTPYKQDLTVSIKRFWLPDPDEIKIMLLGSDDPDTLRGLYLDGAIFDEFAQCDPIVWGEVVRPALSDRLGWAVFIGTPKGNNHFFRRYEMALENDSWYTCVHKSSETGIIPESELAEMRKEMDPEEYEQEMECSFNAAIKGSYYGKALEQLEDLEKVGDFPYDPAYPVDTYWDLGIGDNLSIWFRQKLPGRYRYVEYFETEGKSLAEIAKVVNSKPYSYGRHVIPWDASARDLGTGLTRQETLRNHGIRAEIQKRQAVDDRIQAARLLLAKCEFNRGMTLRGLECLKNYQKEWDSKLMVFKPKPKHDWASHGADSFGYSALDNRESVFSDHRYDNLPREVISDYDEFGG